MSSHAVAQDVDFQSSGFDSAENMTCDVPWTESAGQHLPPTNDPALNCLQLPLPNIFDEQYLQLASIPASTNPLGIPFNCSSTAQSGTTIQSVGSPSHPALLSMPSAIPTPPLILHQPQPRRLIPAALKAATGKALDRFIPRPPSASASRSLRSAGARNEIDARQGQVNENYDDEMDAEDGEFDRLASQAEPLQEEEAIVGPALGLGSDRLTSHPVISLLLQPLSRPVQDSEDAIWDPNPPTCVGSSPGQCRHKDTMRLASHSRTEPSRMHPYRRERVAHKGASHMRCQ